jgi:hypothetical protein
VKVSAKFFAWWASLSALTESLSSRKPLFDLTEEFSLDLIGIENEDGDDEFERFCGKLDIKAFSGACDF